MTRARFSYLQAGLATLSALALVGAAAVAQDRSKGAIESPTKHLLAKNSAGPAAEVVNPKVRPGDIGWHPSFAAACDASRKSGKPVLLFHMMGKLDEQFC